MKKRLLSLFLCSVLSVLPACAEFELESAPGKSCRIVVNSDSVQESEAAEYLKNCLGKMFPQTDFSIVSASEVQAVPEEGTIYVGNTPQLRGQGIDPARFDQEEMLILPSKGSLYLAGGHPRGTLYAVYEFLERAGVVYAAPDTQYIPVKEKMTWDGPPVRRKPAFAYRYTYANVPASDFKRFNKYNGYRVSGEKNGWYAAYGSFGDCHTFERYSRKFPLDDPSVFAMDAKGRRLVPAKAGDSAPLCPSSPKTLELLWTLTAEAYNIQKKRCREQGRPVPAMYEISMDDNLTVCLCPECRKITEEEGCYTGVILRLVNGIALRMRELDPAAKVSMLVYQKTLLFPKVTRPEVNVLPRICVHDREWIVNVLAETVNPVTHKNNEAFLKLFREWEDHSSALGVWEYWTYFTKPLFPFIALDAFFENLKFYQEHKVENVMIEMSHFSDSFFMLKFFLALKLMDDPKRDRNEIIASFMKHYYGKAADVMIRYLEFLDSEVRKESEREPMGARHPSSYAYLNADFFLKSFSLLSEAENLVRDDARSLRHVRWEYIPLDHGLVMQWKKCAGKMPFDKKFLLERIRKYKTDQIEALHLPSDRKKRFLAELENYILGESIELPLPPEVRGEYVFDFKAPQLPIYSKCLHRVEDPDSPSGGAICLTFPGEFRIHNGKNVKCHQLPFPMGAYNRFHPGDMLERRLSAEEIPQDEKYHLWHLGRTYLVNGSRIYMHWTWEFQFVPSVAFTATVDYPYDIYLSLKFTGPSYVKDSKKSDAVYLDRIIVAR